MAKAPIPGLAKTRLISALGPAGAAHLAERMLRATLDQALAAGLGAGVELAITPDTGHPVFDALARDRRVRLLPQGDGDLGQRMARALTHALDGAAPALLIGTDAPSLDAALLQRAAGALADHDAVFGPTLDGGYVLVGLRRPAPWLFDAMTWSTPQVMQQTRARLHAHGWRHAELPPLADIDEPADLQHLPAGWL
jgi:rSAM/selenodomain-associated transferase 1